MDHHDLDAFGARVVAAYEGGGDEPATALWADFEGALTRHIEHEERILLTPLLAVRPREARAVLEEHRHLLARAAHLGADPRKRTSNSVRAFVDELRAHGHHEEHALYRWARAAGLIDDPGEPG